jgi:hypothetical protein
MTKRFALSLAIAGLALTPMLYAAPAHAQASRTWVSGVGDDVNPCSRTAPCKTFAGAISKTAAGGYINCLDPAGYGAVTITKAITIQCEEETGHVLVSGTNGIVVNTPAFTNVTLRGLSLEGLGGAGLNGITFIQAGNLHVQEVVIHDFGQHGINFAPSTIGGGTLVVSDETLIFNNGANSNFAGINIFPGANATTNVSLNGVQLSENANGIIVNGTNVHAGLVVDNASIALNPGAGIKVSGANAVVLIGRSTIFGNANGVSVTGGTVQSFKNNQIAGNTTDGTPITAFPGPGGQPLQ